MRTILNIIYIYQLNYMNLQRSRQREFSNTRLSYSRSIHSNVRPSLSPSQQTSRNINKENKKEKICVNCYNHQLSSDKNLNKARESDSKPQALTLSNIGKETGRDQSRSQAMKANEYNLKKMLQNERKKLQEKQKKRQEKPTEQQLQHIRQMQHKKQEEEKRRNKLRQDLQRQIAAAKQRKQEEFESNRNTIPRPIIDKPINEAQRQNIQNLYKQQLKKQIQQKQLRKAEEQESTKKVKEDNQLSFIRNAELKRKEAQVQQITFKQTVRNELQHKIEAMGQQKEALARQREQEKLNRLNEEKALKQQNLQKQNERRNKIEKYICDLKKQMQINASRRNQQFKWVDQIDNCIIRPRKEQNVQPCDCCKKEVPNRQLSPYIKDIKRK